MSDLKHDEEELPPLTSTEQYITELGRIPHLGSEEEKEVEALAKAGSDVAREQIIETCLHFVSWQAMRLARTYLSIDDYLDLVQVGNLALVEMLDKALTAKGPVAYLCAIARREMRSYCFYFSKIIRVPEHPEALQVAPQSTSLEALIDAVGDTFAYDLLATVLEDLEPEEQRGFDTLYGDLHEVLSILTEKQREVVVRHHGLDDYGPESLAEINQRLKLTRQSSHKRYHGALKRLRKYFKRA